MINVTTASIPFELRVRAQWVGHKAKVPMNPKTYLRAASDNKETWATYREAMDAAEANGWDGVGFMFEAPFVGIDLDDCIENGEINAFARSVIECIGSYTEISPSGTGIHIICKGGIPRGLKTCKKDANGSPFDFVEVYNSGRYFTMTGDVVKPYTVIRTADLGFLFEGKEVIKAVERSNVDSWVLAQLEAVKPGVGEVGRTPTFVRVINYFKRKGLLQNEVGAFLQPWAEKYQYGTDKLLALVADQYRRYPAPVQLTNGPVESLEKFFEDEEPVEWICEPVLAKQSLGFVGGLPETYKTWVMMDLAVEMARGGGDWLGRFPVKSGKVLFIDQERFKGETKRRFKAIMAAKGLDVKDLANSLTIRCGTTTRLDLQHSFDAFRKDLEELRPDIVIVDSFKTFHTKENSNGAEMQLVMERVKQIRQEFGCAFYFIHHENKGAFHRKDDGREPTFGDLEGSISIPAAAEGVLTVVRHDPDTCFVYQTKNTLGKKIAPFTVKVEDVDNDPKKIQVKAY